MQTIKSKHSPHQEAMTLFLRNIPDDSRISEISQFVTPALKGGLFSRSGKILKIKIFAMRDIYANSTAFHALVKVNNSLCGQRAIKKLHARRFKNRHIAVRQYIKRDNRNDRRRSYHWPQSGNFDRRLTDRRRGQQPVEVGDYFVDKGDFYMAWIQNSHC